MSNEVLKYLPYTLSLSWSSVRGEKQLSPNVVFIARNYVQLLLGPDLQREENKVLAWTS